MLFVVQRLAGLRLDPLDASARLGEPPLLAIFAERRPIRGAGAFRARR
jgi:hypothetical protein